MLDLSRRDFARLLALTGSAAFFPERALAAPIRELGLTNAPLPPTPRAPDEKFWEDVRARFLLPRDLGFMNAANLCPTSLPVVDALDRNVRLYEASPSPETRTALMKGREETRKLLAEALRVSPEEIVITRNTSEGNNFVSSGLDLKAGDEVVVFADNHPSNLKAWVDKGKRFGFTVVSVPHVNPHPGTEFYEYVKKNDLITIDSMTDDKGHQLPNIIYPGLDRGELVDWVERFYGEYFFRPRVVWRIVRKAIFNGDERRRLTKEAREYMALRSKRKKFVSEHKAAKATAAVGD